MGEVHLAHERGSWFRVCTQAQELTGERTVHVRRHQLGLVQEMQVTKVRGGGSVEVIVLRAVRGRERAAPPQMLLLVGVWVMITHIQLYMVIYSIYRYI